MQNAIRTNVVVVYIFIELFANACTSCDNNSARLLSNAGGNRCIMCAKLWGAHAQFQALCVFVGRNETAG